MTFGKPDNDREAMLLAELQHRVRNTLATTRLIARRSAETSENLEDYVAHLDGRLAALARVQSAAIRDPLAGIDLGRLVTDELTSAGLGSCSRVQVSGPRLLLHPRAAEPFALALHELMTNAIKFGAVGASNGTLAISWQVEATDGQVATDNAQHLVLDWIESGLQLAGATWDRKGFGTIVLKEMLRHNLGAQTDISLSSSGLVCRIAVPLTERILPSDQ